MKNPLCRMYNTYSRYWQAMVPVKPKYGNYRSRGYASRWRKLGCPLLFLLLPLFGMGQSMRGDTIYYSQSGIGMGQDTIPCRITVVKKVQSFSPSITFDGWKIGNRYYCLDYGEVPKYYRVVKAKRAIK